MELGVGGKLRWCRGSSGVTGHKVRERDGPGQRRLARAALLRAVELLKGVWVARSDAIGLHGDDGLAPEGPCDLPVAILGGEMGVGAFLAGVKM